MKLPKNIHGINKIRDFKICQMYIRDAHTLKDIGSRFGLTASRIQQIVYTNRHLINWDKDYEKLQRVNRLKHEIKHKENNNIKSKKDIPDLQEFLRKEIEGDKPLVDNSKHQTTKIEIFIDDYDRKKTKTTTPLKSADRLP